MRKINNGEKIKTREILTIIAFSTQFTGGDHGGRPLLPWLIERGWLAIGKNAVRKKLEWYEKI